MSRSWTDQEIKWLSLHYGSFPLTFCAQRLGRSVNAIKIAAHRLRKEHHRVENAKNLRNLST